MRIEPDMISLENVTLQPEGIQITFDYLNSSITLKKVRSRIEDKQLIIQMYGGLVWPWSKIQNSYFISVSSEAYDEIYIEGRTQKKCIFHIQEK